MKLLTLYILFIESGLLRAFYKSYVYSLHHVNNVHTYMLKNNPKVERVDLIGESTDMAFFYLKGQTYFLNLYK